MIDLDELQAAINRCAFDCDVLGLSKAECSDLLTRLRQAEKDAARYRWLRNCDTAQTEKLVENGHIVGFGVLDAKIDEAIQCNK